jgi:hypothetical protein
MIYRLRFSPLSEKKYAIPSGAVVEVSSGSETQAFRTALDIATGRLPFIRDGDVVRNFK